MQSGSNSQRKTSSTLSIDGQQAAKQTVKKVGKSIGSIAGDGVSVGKDLNSPVTKRYTGTNPLMER